MTERSLLFVMKPSSWISAESRYCNIFSSHPWTLIVQCRAVCFDVPERIERAPAFPHNWMIFAFILLMEAFLEEKELSSGVTCISTKMKSSRVGGDCTYRRNACLHAYTENHNFRLKRPLQFHTEDKSQSILWPLHTHKWCEVLWRAENNRSAGWATLMSIDVAHSGAKETLSQRKACVPVDSYSIVRVTLYVGKLLPTNGRGYKKKKKRSSVSVHFSFCRECMHVLCMPACGCLSIYAC